MYLRSAVVLTEVVWTKRALLKYLKVGWLMAGAVEWLGHLSLIMQHLSFTVTTRRQWHSKEGGEKMPILLWSLLELAWCFFRHIPLAKKPQDQPRVKEETWLLDGRHWKPHWKGVGDVGSGGSLWLFWWSVSHALTVNSAILWNNISLIPVLYMRSQACGG